MPAMQCLLLAASAAAFRVTPILINHKPLMSTTNDWQQFEVDAWRDAVVAFDDDEDPNNPGYSINRQVAFQHVVPLPRDFKLP